MPLVSTEKEDAQESALASLFLNLVQRNFFSEIKPPLFVTKYKNLAKKNLDVHTVGERVVCLKMTSIAERAAVNKSLILRLM